MNRAELTVDQAEHNFLRYRRPAMVPALTQRQRGFLDLYRYYGIGTEAREAVGVSLEEFEEWKGEPAFTVALAEAEEKINDGIRTEIHNRAVIGWYEPVYQRGVLIGSILRKSDKMLEMLAKARMPEFRDRTASDVSVTGAVAFVPWVGTDEEPAALPAPPPTARGDAAAWPDAKLADGTAAR